MKLIKDSTKVYKYISEDGKYRVTKGYPRMFALECWIVSVKNEEDKYFKTYKEVKEYVEGMYK